MPKAKAETGNRIKDDIQYLLTVIKWRKRIRALVKEIEPDVLHGGWIPEQGFISALSGFHPFLLMPWGSDVLVLPWRTSRVIKAQYIWTILHADMITCDAEYVKSQLVKLSGYDPEKVVVFPRGVDQSVFNTSVNGDTVRRSLGWEDEDIVISTRTLKPIYGMEYLLSAFSQVVKIQPQSRLLICGDGPLMEKLKNYCKLEGMDEFVHFEGAVKNEDLPKYLAAADVYVSSSLSDGTSVSLLEAISMGLPVVVSDIPTNREWIKDGMNGILTRPEDPYAIRDALVSLLSDEEKRQTFSERNVQLAREKANWDYNFTKLEMIYRSMIKKVKNIDTDPLLY
jgi:glycosyltransferase involved in cell wall biosynthesis